MPSVGSIRSETRIFDRRSCHRRQAPAPIPPPLGRGEGSARKARLPRSTRSPRLKRPPRRGNHDNGRLPDSPTAGRKLADDSRNHSGWAFRNRASRAFAPRHDRRHRLLLPGAVGDADFRRGWGHRRVGCVISCRRRMGCAPARLARPAPACSTRRSTVAGNRNLFDCCCR